MYSYEALARGKVLINGEDSVMLPTIMRNMFTEMVCREVDPPGSPVFSHHARALVTFDSDHPCRHPSLPCDITRPC